MTVWHEGGRHGTEFRSYQPMAATSIYANINVPVCLIWGDKDWSRPNEREHDYSLLAGARRAIVENGGHFLPLDRPDAVIEQIRRR